MQVQVFTVLHHAPITLQLLTGIHSHPPPRLCFNASLLKDPDLIKYFEQEWVFFLEITISTPWETTKEVVRGRIIAYSKNKEKKKLQENIFYRWR